MGELTPPGFLEDLGHPPDVLRRMIKSMAGDLPGVHAPGDMKVTTTGTTPLAVSVAAGSAFVAGTDRSTVVQGYYHVTNDAARVVNLNAAHATLYRRDIIIAEVRDDAEDGGTFNDWILTTVSGTPGTIGGAAPPAPPDDSLILAEVLVAPTSTTVVANNITDRRPITLLGRKPKGVIPENSSAYGPDAGILFSTEVDIVTNTYTLEAGRRYRIDFFYDGDANPLQLLTVKLKRGSTTLRTKRVSSPHAVSNDAYVTVPGFIVETSAGGTISYKITASCQNGGQCTTMDAGITVEDVGAA